MKTKATRAILIAVIAGVALFAFWYMSSEPKLKEAVIINDSKPTVAVADTAVSVLIADTPALREKGLSGHPGLGSNEGMLFLFEQPGIYPFWMKEMLFPIDIIWISANWKIVHIEPNVAPETYPEAFFPKAPAQYVLEVPAGFSTQHELTIGMPILFHQ